MCAHSLRAYVPLCPGQRPWQRSRCAGPRTDLCAGGGSAQVSCPLGAVTDTVETYADTTGAACRRG